jgi:RNA polymerase sigma factor (sigma-70 family)
MQSVTRQDEDLTVRHDPTILALYLAHRGELVNYANNIVRDRASAEDVVQEAWVRFGTATQGRTLEEPVSYLYRIVRNLATDGLRRKIREDRVIEPGIVKTLHETADDTPSPETAIGDKDELRLLAEAWDELPERTRIAMEMRQLGDNKLKDIAAHLGVSITVAHGIISDGLKHLRRRVRPLK